MKAKDYLGQIKKIDRLIDNKLAEVEHWKAVASGTTAQSEGERVQAMGSKQKMADAVARYMDMEAEINADRLVDIRQEVIKTIEQLPAIEYDVLHKIYVQYKEFYEIADVMKKSYSWVTTIHGRGLAKVQKIIDNSEINSEIC